MCPVVIADLLARHSEDRTITNVRSQLAAAGTLSEAGDQGVVFLNWRTTRLASVSVYVDGTG